MGGGPVNGEGYTITYRPHNCPRPQNLPLGTHIVCNECGRKWERSFFGWARIEDKREE